MIQMNCPYVNYADMALWHLSILSDEPQTLFLCTVSRQLFLFCPKLTWHWLDVPLLWTFQFSKYLSQKQKVRQTCREDRQDAPLVYCVISQSQSCHTCPLDVPGECLVYLLVISCSPAQQLLPVSLVPLYMNGVVSNKLVLNTQDCTHYNFEVLVLYLSIATLDFYSTIFKWQMLYSLLHLFKILIFLIINKLSINKWIQNTMNKLCYLW